MLLTPKSKSDPFPGPKSRYIFEVSHHRALKIVPQAEAKSEAERVRLQGKEGAERVRELEGQLEWVRSEREEEVQALRAEKKALEQRAREAEGQLAQIKSRKKDELKVSP